MDHLKQFIFSFANLRGHSKNITADSLIRSSLVLLDDLPAARDVVFEYFALVFDVSVDNYVTFIAKDPQGNPPEDDYLTDIQEALEKLVNKGPPAWVPLIASWSLELVGKLSNKYWPTRKLDIGSACNLWLNCGAMRCLVGLISSCFRKLNNSEAENCLETLLATFRKYSPTFDWVVARLGGCFPLKIITQILQCGLKRFCEDVRCHFDSEVGILDYLSFSHENDLNYALKEMLDSGFCPKTKYHCQIVPYLMQLSTYSDIILQSIVSESLELYNPDILEAINCQTSNWMQNIVFRDMQPSLNNIALKLKTNGSKMLITVAKLAEKYVWCHDFIEYTLQELEQLIFMNRSCPLIDDLSTEESKILLWKSCTSELFLEQQTAVRLLLLVSTNYPHIYHQTISELLTKSYEANKNGLGALIRMMGSLSGVMEYPDVKPGLQMALERIYLKLQYHDKDSQDECINVIKNLVLMSRMEKSFLSTHLKQQPIFALLNECLSKLLQIFECVLRRLLSEMNPNNSNTPIVASTFKTDSDTTATVKRQKVDNIYESQAQIILPQQSDFGVLAHIIVQLLNSIEAGVKQHALGMIDILKLASLSVKYFFWSLTEKSPTMRSTAVNRAFILFQRQCNARKSARTACLRELVEGALFNYCYLLGAYDEKIDDSELGIAEHEKLLLLNQKQGIGTNTNRSVLHAGIIGKGLKPENSDFMAQNPDPEYQNLFLRAVDSCCNDLDKTNSVDGYSNVSLLLVEMVSSDVMYNGLPFPDEEFTKVTMERDLIIRRSFRACPILWGLLGLIAAHRPALCFSSVLLRALCASFLHQWRAKNVNKLQPPDKNEELLYSTKRLLQILAMGQLLPHPLSNLHMIIENFDAPEIALILKECVWNYLKDNVPSPALFNCDANGLHWRNSSLFKPSAIYIDTLRNIMQKRLPKLGSHYHQMFAMSELQDSTATTSSSSSTTTTTTTTKDD